MTKEKFCKTYNLTEDQFYGKVEIEGSLYLRYVKKIPKGFNPTVRGALDLISVTEIPKGFNPTVGGNLYLTNLKQIPEGFSPTVGSYLDLVSVTEIPEGFNPTVEGSLDLRSVVKIPEGFNPTVGGDLYLTNLKQIPEGFNPTVGGSLDLRSVVKIPEGFNPTVGSYLDLSSVTEIPTGFNPTVGGYLDLNSVKQIPKGFNPSKEFPNFLTWKNEKYILADGIFAEVISKHGNTFKLKRINQKDFFFLIINEDGIHSHGDTLKEAFEDLVFKKTEKNLDEYKNLTKESILNFNEAIKLYRSITGACSFGTKSFVNSLEEKKKEYTIAEIIKLTKGQYGNEKLVEFFKKK